MDLPYRERTRARGEASSRCGDPAVLVLRASPRVQNLVPEVLNEVRRPPEQDPVVEQERAAPALHVPVIAELPAEVSSSGDCRTDASADGFADSNADLSSALSPESRRSYRRR